MAKRFVKTRLQYRILPLLFTLGGMLLGLLLYELAGCAAGSCPLTATPVRAMLYSGILGWLVAAMITPSRSKGCSL